MKKIIYSLFALVAFTLGAITLTACGDDDNGGSNSDSVDGVSIVGTWRYYYDSSDPSRGRVYDQITFNSNHTGNLVEEVGYGSDTPEPFTWTMTGNTISMKWTEGSEIFTVTQIIDDNTVTISNGKKTFTIYRQAASGGDSDDDTPSPSTGAFQGAKRVFSKALVSEIVNSSQTTKLTYNTDGFLTKVEEIKSSGTKTANITYAENKISVVWTRDYGTSKDSPASMVVNIGSNGFASGGEYLDGGGSVETFSFEYNGDNRLSKAKWNGEEEVTEFTYTNGDGVISTRYNYGTLNKTYNIGYTSINNTFMVQPEFMGADLDDVGDILGFAGALGYPTTHLISTRTSSSGSPHTYVWTVNSAGVPTQLVSDGTTSTIKCIDTK